MKLEICVDNYESLITAAHIGADRIELCASLSEGGLTPPQSFIEAALGLSIPVFVMIRPRNCDFLYTSEEIEMMHRDIYIAKTLGVPGVVFGVLTPQGEIDGLAMKSLIDEARGMEVTCHRAVDQANDIYAALDILAALGVNRVLTSGLEENPLDGMKMLKKIVTHAQNRLKIMAAGVTPEDVRQIVETTSVHEVHSAAATIRKSAMNYIKSDAKMGHSDDFSLNIVDADTVRQIKANLAGL